MFLGLHNVGGAGTKRVLHRSLHGNISDTHIQAEDGVGPGPRERGEKKDKVVAVMSGPNGGQVVFTF